MNTAYQQAANNAAELERAYKFTQAGTMWLAAYEYASDKNREYCANRAFFCNKFGLKLEVDNARDN